MARLTPLPDHRPPPAGGEGRPSERSPPSPGAAGRPRVALRPARARRVRRAVAGGDRRAGRAQAHRRGGLAGLRRPRGRRVRAPRPPGHDRLVGRRARRVDDHLVGARRPARWSGGTATGSSAGPGATRCSPAPCCPGPWAGSGRVTAWSRSGTGCRSSRRCGPAAPRSSSSTTSTPRCGRWCCPPGMAERGYAIEHRLAPPSTAGAGS